MRAFLLCGAIESIVAQDVNDLVASAFVAEGAEVATFSFEINLPTPGNLDQLACVDAAQGAVDLRSFEFCPTQWMEIRQILAQFETVLVPHDEVELLLTGLSGSAVQGSRARGEDLGAGLAADAEARRWLTALGIVDQPGCGAVQGLGAVALSAGCLLADKFSWQITKNKLAETAQQADLVVTSCTELDFLTRGGEQVRRVVALAEDALRPAIVLTARNFISVRELRLAGIEAAYALFSGNSQETATKEQLADLAQKVARTWRF